MMGWVQVEKAQVGLVLVVLGLEVMALEELVQVEQDPEELDLVELG